jgi:hypothetical protein
MRVCVWFQQNCAIFQAMGRREYVYVCVGGGGYLVATKGYDEATLFQDYLRVRGHGSVSMACHTLLQLFALCSGLQHHNGH